MEEKKQTWGEAMREIGEALGKCTVHTEKVNEAKNIRLGMSIERLKMSYTYGKLIKYLKGDDSENGSMYFYELKPLYDEFGYEKVNRVLLALEEENAQESEVQKDE